MYHAWQNYGKVVKFVDLWQDNQEKKVVYNIIMRLETKETYD